MIMKIKSIPSKKSSTGQSLVEFAISLTLILLLLSGAVDFGMALFSYISIRDAAQEGAVYGSFNPADVNGIILRVRNASVTPVDLADVSAVEVIVAINRPCEGGSVRVTVNYDYPISMPFIGPIIDPDGGGTLPISASVVNTILTPQCP
jgi:hypothetical protein